VGAQLPPAPTEFNPWRHLYSARRPSRWALSHIVVAIRKNGGCQLTQVDLYNGWIMVGYVVCLNYIIVSIGPFMS